MRLLEKCNVIAAGAPADINGAGLTGDYVSLKGAESVAAVMIFGDGTASQDINLTIMQAQDVSGTGAKVCNCLVTGRIHTMYAATYAAYAALTGWTQVTQATADEQFLDTTNGEAVGITVLDIEASDLDVANGFDCIRVDMSDPGAAKVAALIYILHGLKNPSGPTLLADPLVN